MGRKVFINLAVKDFQKTKSFFEGLGFSFNTDFTGDDSGALILNNDTFVMFSTEKFFTDNIKRQPADTSQVLETVTALSVDSREEVDELADKALANGATAHDAGTIDDDFMYNRGFYDLDGHLWELTYLKSAQ